MTLPKPMRINLDRSNNRTVKALVTLRTAFGLTFKIQMPASTNRKVWHYSNNIAIHTLSNVKLSKGTHPLQLMPSEGWYKAMISKSTTHNLILTSNYYFFLPASAFIMLFCTFQRVSLYLFY